MIIFLKKCYSLLHDCKKLLSLVKHFLLRLAVEIFGDHSGITAEFNFKIEFFAKNLVLPLIIFLHSKKYLYKILVEFCNLTLVQEQHTHFRSVYIILGLCKYDSEKGMLIVAISKAVWRHSNLSELTPIIFKTGLTHLSSEASISSW